MFRYAESFGELKLNDTETGLFSALSLATAGKEWCFFLLCQLANEGQSCILHRCWVPPVGGGMFF